jgi:hypothetical protein
MLRGLVRIFKTKAFQRWADKINLNDEILFQSIEQMQNGQYEANLGGFLYKKRIAIGNKGKSGGLRTIIAFKKDDKAFFVYGFAKNNIGNINEAEMIALKYLAKIYFLYSNEQIELAIKNIKIIEVIKNG